MSNIDSFDNDSGGRSRNTLMPSSIKLLYEGMTVHDDIYDSDCLRMLMSAGSVLTADLIERMRRLNAGRDVIYVSGRTHKTMATKRPDIPIEKRKDFEHSTGYMAALTRIRELYRDILQNKKTDRDGFIDLAKYLSQYVKTAPATDIMTLINAVTPADEYLLRHMVNVGLLNGLLAVWLTLSDERIDKLVLIGLLHDCGYALVPQNTLFVPRVFTKIDYEVVKMHPIRTEQLLLDFPDDIRLTASSHHERIDGSGYPKGISSNSVTGAARITAVSDTYESIVSARPFRSPKSPFYAMGVLDDLAPAQIDNDVVNIVKENMPGTLIGKPVTMSDGTIGIVRECDPNDIEYPTVEISNHLTKTREMLHCVSMFLDE